MIKYLVKSTDICGETQYYRFWADDFDHAAEQQMACDPDCIIQTIEKIGFLREEK